MLEERICRFLDSYPRRRCEIKAIAGEISEMTGDEPKRGRIMKIRMMVP